MNKLNINTIQNLRIECLVVVASITVIIFLLSTYNSAFAVPYSNYTSEKYQIQLQYPTGWDVTEKQSRFDEGTDLKIQSVSMPGGLILMQYLNFTEEPVSDFQTLFYQLYKSTITGDYGKEVKVIEQPSFTTIDGQRAGSFLYTTKDKYEEFGTKVAAQYWIVFAGNHGYLLAFDAVSSVFDDPQNKEIRDHFIKSIDFLGVSNTTQSNQPSRFD
jgi:hypothetical protein